MPQPDGVFIEDAIMLQALANSGESPKDAEDAARLFQRWMHLRLTDKPTAAYTGTDDSAGFLAWLTRDVGDKAYQLIKQRHPEEAAELRRQVLVLCYLTQNRCDRLSGPGPTPALGKRHAEAVRMLPERILGSDDARFSADTTRRHVNFAHTEAEPH